MSSSAPHEPLVVSRRDGARALDQRDVRRAVSSGDLVRIRRGYLVEGSAWVDLTDRERHVLRIRAAAASATQPIVVAGISAAALWGLPLPGEWPASVTVLVPWSGGGRSQPLVRKTSAGFSSATVVEHGGMRVTSLERTTIDVLRITSFEHAVAIADWVVSEANVHRSSLEGLSADLDAYKNCRRLNHVRRVLRFADGRSGSFGESVARAVIHRLGFAAPELQVEFRDVEGRIIVDFYWPATRAVIEFDGFTKYADDRFGGGDPARAVWNEKRREDRLRRMVGSVGRIVWSDLQHPSRCAAILRAAGVPLSGTA